MNKTKQTQNQTTTKVSRTWHQSLLIYIKGLAMGAADVVPGVSGGTIAFITGIYEELINSIKNLDLGLLTNLRQNGLKSTWQQYNISFLVILMLGILTSILTLAKAIEYLLNHHEVLLWSFFFGLIAASAIYIGKQITTYKPITIAAIIIGTAVAYAISTLSPAQAPDNPLMTFGAGAIAITAMILPGISGSFMLLLMGMYPRIISAVNQRDVFTLLLFAAGCGVGLLLFVRILSWLFKHHRNTTLAMLTGFMLGSLNKVYPWKITLTTITDRHGIEIPLTQSNVLPQNYDGNPQLIAALALMLVGFAAVFILEKLGNNPKAKT